MDRKVKSEVIRLNDENGHYLAQVIVTSNHGLYVDSDYGSFVFRWGETKEDFKKFLQRIDNGYLSTKIETELGYIFGRLNKKQSTNILRVVEKVLPALQEYLRNKKEGE